MPPSFHPWPVERYRPLLRLQVRQIQLDPRFQRRVDSSDLVQSALAKAVEHRDQFRGATEAELVKWLLEILGHIVVDEVRKATAKKRDIALEQSLQALLAESTALWQTALADRASSPAAQAERNEEWLRLAGAIEELPDDQRDVILLRDLQGTSVVDIAARLGRTEKSVSGLYLRGRKKLRALLNHEP
jgi:RNA polymerase sigma-70 factor (ECF subfamily)